MLLKVVQEIFYLNYTAYLEARFNALTSTDDNCHYSLNINSVIVVADDVAVADKDGGGVYQHQVKVVATWLICDSY